MTNENGKSILIGLLENEKRSLIRGEKSTFDAEAIIDYLKELCGDKFRETFAKISCILTDNTATNRAIPPLPEAKNWLDYLIKILHFHLHEDPSDASFIYARYSKNIL